MEALDGNSIGGLLIDVFGADLTAAGTACATCGATRAVAELVVYSRAPGTVVRCRSCGAVLMVFVEVRGVIHADLAGLAALEGYGGGPPQITADLSR
jgi:ribosomal protein S27E